MDVDLRNCPTFPHGWSKIPKGGFDLTPGACYRLIFDIGPDAAVTPVAVAGDGSVDCGPDWEAVTEDSKIIGFNRKSASVG